MNRGSESLPLDSYENCKFLKEPQAIKECNQIYIDDVFDLNDNNNPKIDGLRLC